jgi:hypothetical protein
MSGNNKTYLGLCANCPIFLPDFNKIGVSQLIFIKVSNIKFHGNRCMRTHERKDNNPTPFLSKRSPLRRFTAIEMNKTWKGLHGNFQIYFPDLNHIWIFSWGFSIRYIKSHAYASSGSGADSRGQTDGRDDGDMRSSTMWTQLTERLSYKIY